MMYQNIGKKFPFIECSLLMKVEFDNITIKSLY